MIDFLLSGSRWRSPWVDEVLCEVRIGKDGFKISILIAGSTQVYTVKLGYNELGYNELPLIANTFDCLVGFQWFVHLISRL
jgi:hypothetical protein